MDNQRVILFFALSVVLLLLWQAWQQNLAVTSAPPATISTDSTTPAQADIPQAPPSTDGAVSQAPVMAAITEQQDLIKSDQRIHVVTDLLNVEIDTVGGDLRVVDLRAFPVIAGKPDQPFRLMQDQGSRLFVAQSGILSRQQAPDHHAQYEAEQTEYQLAAGADAVVVPLHWKSPEGVMVTKTYTFHRNSYVIDVADQVKNNSGQKWQGRIYRQLQRSAPGDNESSAFIYTYTGGVIYSNEKKYEKIKFENMEDESLNREITGGWAAMIQHYFLGAWIPAPEDNSRYYSKALQGQRYVLGLISQEKVVESTQSTEFASRIYVGPKDQDRLEKAAPGLKLTVDYGVLTVLAEPLFWLLRHIHKVVQNWGWSIVLLTLLIKLVFFKLSEASYKSMANMRRLQPKIVSIRERYGDDRQRMSQAMMELYKKEKINPVGGCLPILVQIPVFIALYWVLLESVELRQADFIFWIHDLSTKDPFYILPLLMGITMFIQQRLNPAPPDPIQAKVMMALPVIFTAFFAFFPSGLVLYWVANSFLSILQQWTITRRIEKAASKV